MKGQSLLEVIIALAIFALLSATLISMIVGGLMGLTQGGDFTRASAIADEALEALRSIRHGAWNELADSPAIIKTQANEWVIENGTSQIVDGKFTRTLSFSPVCRNSVNAIVACPGSGTDYTDVQSKKVTVTVAWETRPGITDSVTRIAYLTNWDSRDWIQTDWSCGSGQALWQTNPNIKKYNTQIGSATINHGVEGKLTLNPIVQARNWQSVAPPSGVSQLLNDMSSVNSTDIWAVGNAGTILHYTGTWSRYTPSPTTNNIYTIQMIDANKGWAAGSNGTILRYTNGVWTAPYTIPNQTLNDIFMIYEGGQVRDGWVVGNGGVIFRYNPTTNTWIQVASPTNRALNAIAIGSDGLGWAVGNIGTVIRWNGSVWINSGFNFGAQPPNVNDVFMINSCEAWITGSDGMIYRLQGTSLQASYDTGGQIWNAIHMVTPTYGWVVGNGGAVYRWNGTQWNVVTSNTTRALNGVSFSSPWSGWAVGANATLIRFSASPANTYETTGTLQSSAFYMGDSSPVQALEWSGSVPGCGAACFIRFQVRTAPDSAGVPGTWTSWYGSSGAGSYFTVQRGSLIPLALNGNRWAQYQVFLSGTGAETPSVQEIRINYK